MFLGMDTLAKQGKTKQVSATVDVVGANIVEAVASVVPLWFLNQRPQFLRDLIKTDVVDMVPNDVVVLYLVNDVAIAVFLVSRGRFLVFAGTPVHASPGALLRATCAVQEFRVILRETSSAPNDERQGRREGSTEYRREDPGQIDSLQKVYRKRTAVQRDWLAACWSAE